MYDLMIYSLKVGVCLAVFYLFFKLLLSRETFHRFNRIVVLGAMFLSFVLPLCVITVYREIPVRNFHILRHSCATRCIEYGMDIKSLSEILGHADVQTTLRMYVHPSMESKRSGLELASTLSGIA